MIRKNKIVGLALVWATLATVVGASEPASKIAWFGKLSDGLAEAKRVGRPIFLVSAAPQCQGVPGMW